MKSSKFTGCWHSVWAIGFCVFAIIVTLTIGLFNHTQELYIRRSICMIGLYAEALDTQTMTELISNSFASQDQDDLYAAGCETLYKVGYGTSYQSLMRIPYQAGYLPDRTGTDDWLHKLMVFLLSIQEAFDL